MMINKILKLAGSFYSLAVPLDALIQTDKMEGVPDEQEYVDYYGVVDNLYRIIYADQDFIRILLDSNLFNKIQTVSDAKNAIKQRISYFKKEVNHPALSNIPDDDLAAINNQIQKLWLDYDADVNDSDLRDLENSIKISWLSDKFNPEAINVIAYRMDPNDFVGPEALDHDIAHSIFDSKKYGTRSRNFHKFIDAWLEDYSFYYNGEDVTDKVKLLSDTFEEAISNFICYMLLKNTSGFKVSDLNTKGKKGEVFDVISDIAIEYIKNGNNLSNLKFSPEKCYALAFPDYTLRSKTFYIINPKISQNKDGVLEIKPKNESLPHLNAELDNIIKYFEKTLSSYLDFLKGKVFLLWGVNVDGIDIGS